MKAQLYASAEEWHSTHATIKTYLGIPNGTTTEYAVISQVDNPTNADFEKYIFPVVTEYRWACDDQFPDAVEWNSDWILPPE